MASIEISRPISVVSVRQLSPATDEEIARIVEIQFSAFEGDPYQEALFPGDYYSEALRASARERTRQHHQSDPTGRWLLAERQPIADETSPSGEDLPSGGPAVTALGFAIFNVYAHPREESEWRRAPTVDWCTGRQREIAINFLSMNQRLRERLWAGRPYILLNLLCVHQDVQRMGAGSALVSWGMRLADELQLPIHIEASPAGYQLYRKLGFEEAAREIVKAEEFDGDHDREYIAMVRYPATSDAPTQAK